MSYRPHHGLTDKQKETVYLKNGGECSRCGVKALSHWVINEHFRRKNKTFMLVNMEIHHKKKFSEGGTKSIDNFEFLCVSCHKQEHSKCRAAE